MKKKITFTLTAFFFLGMLLTRAQQGTYTPKPAIYAVVVGISGYKDPGIPGLKYGEKDAKDFYNFLLSPGSGSIPRDNISLLTGAQATRGNIFKEVVGKFMRAGKEDLIIFYFSGHGKSGETDNTGYLLGYDTENGNEAGTAIDMSELKNKIDNSHAKVKLSYVDACHAGLFKSDGAKGIAEDNQMVKVYMDGIMNAAGGSAVFLASKSNQQSLEDDKLGNGVFTYYLLKGLQGEADKERVATAGYNDKVVTVGEMETYLSDKIPAFTKFKQQPFIEYSCEENFPLSILNPHASLETLMARSVPGKSKDMRAGAGGNGGGVSGAGGSSNSGYANNGSPGNSSADNADKQMSKKECTDERGRAFGAYCFVNNFKEPILLYFCYANGGNQANWNLLLAPGEKVCAPRMWVGFFKDNDFQPAVRDFEFYFKSIDDSKPTVFGTMILSVSAGVMKTLDISQKNLYLSKTGKKH